MEIANLWLSVLGSLASIVGLFITVAVFRGLKSIKAFYVAKATVPQQLTDLGKLRQDIDDLLNGRFDAGSRERIREYAFKASVNIKNLSPKLREVDRSQYGTQVEPNMKAFNQAYDSFVAEPNKENVRTMNEQLYAFLLASELVLKDDSWRRAS